MMERKPCRFTVEYGIDIHADNPFEAALEVLRILRDEKSSSMLFTVTEVNEEGEEIGPSMTIDLWHGGGGVNPIPNPEDN